MLAALDLDHEIAMYQFAQGVYSADGLLKQLSQLDEPKKMRQLLDLHSYVRQFEPLDADVQQALADSSLVETDIAHVFTWDARLKFAIYTMMHLPDNETEKVYAFMLYLFKAIYQRRFTLGDPTDWRYWDLSNPEVVQHIQARYQEAVEAVYANASFRSEFMSMAKLWHEQTTLSKAKSQEPEAERQTHFTFLNYDEVISESLKGFMDKQAHGIRVLRDALGKALAKQYGVETAEAQRVLLNVLARHLREMHNTDLF